MQGSQTDWLGLHVVLVSFSTYVRKRKSNVSEERKLTETTHAAATAGEIVFFSPSLSLSLPISRFPKEGKSWMAEAAAASRICEPTKSINVKGGEKESLIEQQQ